MYLSLVYDDSTTLESSGLDLVLGFYFSTPKAVASEFAAQSNFNLGVDFPADDATHTGDSYLLRFQLQKEPNYFTPRASFTLAYGSGLMGGEFNLGLAVYPFNKLKEDLRAQPFFGFGGDIFLGSRDSKTVFSPGGGLFAGVDIRMFGNVGLTLESDYLFYASQKSARLWLGFNFSLASK